MSSTGSESPCSALWERIRDRAYVRKSRRAELPSNPVKTICLSRHELSNRLVPDSDSSKYQC